MSGVKHNIRPRQEEGWVKVGAARCEKCGVGHRLRDDGGRK